MEARVKQSVSKRDSAPVRVVMHLVGNARSDVRVMRAATVLIEAAYSVSIVDVEDDTTRPRQETLDGICLKHVLMPTWSVHRKRSDARFLFGALVVFMRSLLQLLHTPADIYHAHDETALPACYIAALLRRKPLIFDAHEVPTSALVSRRMSMKLLLKRCFLLVVPSCRAVITVSPSIVKEFRRRYRCRKVVLVRNIAQYQVLPKSERLRQQLRIGAGVRIALYQGNLQPMRGLDRLIRAATFLEDDIVIVLMGQDVRGTQAQLETLIEREGLHKRVRIIAPVPYKELLDYTASADIGIVFYSPDYPEVQMYLPNKVFEYIMAGLPLLATPLEAVEEVIKTYDVGQILPSFVPIEIGTAITAMLNDRIGLERMRRNALEAARRELHWREESQKLIQLYQEIFPSQSKKREFEQHFTSREAIEKA